MSYNNIDNIKQEIIKQLKDKNINYDSIDHNIQLIDAHVIDSMAFVNILLELEDIFNIEIDFENIEFAEITTINGLANHILKETGK